MPFKAVLKKPHDIIVSAEWNDALNEVERLGKQLEDVAHELARFKKCAEKKRSYLPGHPQADPDGCVDCCGATGQQGTLRAKFTGASGTLDVFNAFFGAKSLSIPPKATLARFKCTVNSQALAGSGSQGRFAFVAKGAAVLTGICCYSVSASNQSSMYESWMGIPEGADTLNLEGLIDGNSGVGFARVIIEVLFYELVAPPQGKA
jgi:hypothetical protein